MYAAIAFALLSIVAASPGSYSSFPAYGVNQIAQTYPVQTVGLNAAAVQHYGVSPYAQYAAAPYAAVQKVVAAPAFYGAQRAQRAYYGAPAAHAYNHAQVERDFNIESIGERYAIQNGPASIQYSFVKDAPAHHAQAQKVIALPQAAAYGGWAAAPAAYGAWAAPHQARVARVAHANFAY